MAQLTQSQDSLSPEQWTLPFAERKQEAILGHLLTDQGFFLRSRSLIRPQWFASGHARRIWKIKLDWYEQYERVATVEEIKNCPEITREENKVRAELTACINNAIRETQNYGLDALSHELTTWLRARIFIEGTDKAKQKFNNERYDEAYVAMDESLKSIKEAYFEKDNEVDFSNFRDHFAKQQEERNDGLTFGLKIVDDLLLPGNLNGGLLKGDTTIMLAPTNVGKTTSMITTIVANLKARKRVLFISHEGRPTDLQNKIWCAFLDATLPEIFEQLSDKEKVKIVERASLFISKYLTYVPFNKAGGAVEDVEAIIRRYQERCIAVNGVGYDMLVDDYPAKLTTLRAQHGGFSKRDIDLVVYNYFVQLALEYDFHSLLAIQTNREGAKVNKGNADIRRLLMMEDVSESYGPMQLATNVISINRDPKAKAMNRLTYYIDKSRSNDTGWAIVCRTNYAHAITHSNKLGATYYRGASTMAQKIDDLLRDYTNKEIPFEVLAKD